MKIGDEMEFVGGPIDGKRQAYGGGWAVRIPVMPNSSDLETHTYVVEEAEGGVLAVHDPTKTVVDEGWQERMLHKDMEYINDMFNRLEFLEEFYEKHKDTEVED